LRIARAALTYFGLVFGAGFLLGAIRVPLLVPRLGVRHAELLEMPLMLAVIVLAAGVVVRRFALPRLAGVRLAVGCLALALLVAAELAVAWLFQGLGPGGYIASRDPVSGGVYVAMLGLFALMPSLR
jgi:hypothetical protein